MKKTIDYIIGFILLAANTLYTFAYTLKLTSFRYFPYEDTIAPVLLLIVGYLFVLRGNKK